MTEPAQNLSKRAVWLCFLLALMVFLPALANQWPMDDDPMANSMRAASGGVEKDIVVHELKWPWWYFQFFYWYGESGNDGLYRPISILSYAYVYHAFGRWLDPSWEALPQHLVNLLLHVWAVWLVLQLLLRAGVSQRVSLMTMFMFAVGAIHTEAVASIVGRAELFVFCFGCQATLWLSNAGANRDRPSHGRLIGAAYLFFCAYCSKESSVAWVPFVFCYLLVIWLHGRRRGEEEPIPRWIFGAAPLVLLPGLVAYFALRLWVNTTFPPHTGGDFSQNPLLFADVVPRILTGFKLWGYGLLKCLQPYPMCCIYSTHFTVTESGADPKFLGSMLLLGTFVGLGFWSLRRQPTLFLAMTVFFGFSAVTANVLVATGTIFGERTYYTASLGVYLLVAFCLSRLRGFAARVGMSLLIVWCAANIAVAMVRCTVWKDSDTLFAHDVKVYPRSIDLLRKASSQHLERKEWDQAEAFLLRAIELHPTYVLAHHDLAETQFQKGNLEEAMRLFKKVLDMPERQLTAAGAREVSYNRIGMCLVRLGRDKEALPWFRKTLKTVAGNKDAAIQVAILGFGEVPREELLDMYNNAEKRFEPDAELIVALGALGVKLEVDPDRAANMLKWGIENFPVHRRGHENYFKAQMFLADAIRQIAVRDRNPGASLEADRMFEALIQNPAVPADVRSVCGEKLRAMRGLR